MWFQVCTELFHYHWAFGQAQSIYNVQNITIWKHPSFYSWENSRTFNGHGFKFATCNRHYQRLISIIYSTPDAPWCWNIYQHLPYKWPSFVGKFSSTIPIYWECHHHNWRSHIFQRVFSSTTNRPRIIQLNWLAVCFGKPMAMESMLNQCCQVCLQLPRTFDAVWGMISTWEAAMNGTWDLVKRPLF